MQMYASDSLVISDSNTAVFISVLTKHVSGSEISVDNTSTL